MDNTYIMKQLRNLADRFKLSISEDIIEKVIRFSTFKVYSKGEVMARTGDRAKYAGIVINGVARSYYIDNDGNDITQFFADEGSFCMDSGMLGFEESVAMWESLVEATVMLFEVKRMKELIMSDEQLKTVWIGLLESGMRYKVYRENGFLVQNATERYIAFRNKFPELVGRIPQQYIATYLGIKPESLSRIKGALKEEFH